MIIISGLLNRIILKILERRTEEVTDIILNFLGKKNKILDIGCGFCTVTQKLSAQGFKVTSLDIKDSSIFPEIIPTIYNGKIIPFPNRSFDTSLLITVLHHTPNPKRILVEAKRISPMIIVMEDIITNPIQKYLTFVMDSILNFEFFNHPHTNKSDKEWRKLFRQVGLRIKKTESHQFWGLFQSVTYVLVE